LCTTPRLTRSRQAMPRRGRRRWARASGGGCGSADVLRAFKIPLTWPDMLKRTAVEVMADNCLGLAAQLAYYFFLALFPALLFLVAVISFMPVSGMLDAVTAMLARVAPGEVIAIIQDQILKIANDKSSGLLTLGMVGTIWSCSSG